MLNYLFLVITLFSSTLFAKVHVNEDIPITHVYQYPELQNFQLIGEATFSILFWDVYQSKLLTTTGKYPLDYQHEKLLYEIHYLADISKNDLIKRTIEQWQHLDLPEKAYKVYIPKLKKIWPNISQGDTLALLIYNQGSAFYFNQEYIGAIKSAEFGKIFLDIWLAKHTSEPKLRSQLLGATSHD